MRAMGLTGNKSAAIDSAPNLVQISVNQCSANVFDGPKWGVAVGLPPPCPLSRRQCQHMHCILKLGQP